MAAKQSSNLMAKVGVWAYILGIVIAAILGVVSWLQGDVSISPSIVGILVVLGVVVGLLNISDEEVQMFLLGSIAFVVASTGMASVFDGLGLTALQIFMSAIAIFTAPGALVVAFKALYQVAHDD